MSRESKIELGLSGVLIISSVVGDVGICFANVA